MIDRSRSRAGFLALGAFALVACGGDGGGGMPDRLYLALLGSETAVQLVEREPEPF
jgi:hypothetical protein